MNTEIITLKDLSIGDKFIAAVDLKKGKPKWEVLGKPEFNIRHGSATRECKNLDTQSRESKSCRLKIIKLPINPTKNPII